MNGNILVTLELASYSPLLECCEPSKTLVLAGPHEEVMPRNLLRIIVEGVASILITLDSIRLTITAGLGE